MENPTNYISGKEFNDAVVALVGSIGSEPTANIIKIIAAEISSTNTGLRWELHQKLEKTFKSTEEERMQAMTDLERRITKSIADNTENDRIRFRWVMGSVLITTANLIVLVSLYLK